VRRPESSKQCVWLGAGGYCSCGRPDAGAYAIAIGDSCEHGDSLRDDNANTYADCVRHGYANSNCNSNSYRNRHGERYGYG
jgi:hypothetical protein